MNDLLFRLYILRTRHYCCIYQIDFLDCLTNRLTAREADVGQSDKLPSREGIRKDPRAKSKAGKRVKASRSSEKKIGPVHLERASFHLLLAKRFDSLPSSSFISQKTTFSKQHLTSIPHLVQHLSVSLSPFALHTIPIHDAVLEVRPERSSQRKSHQASE